VCKNTFETAPILVKEKYTEKSMPKVCNILMQKTAFLKPHLSLPNGFALQNQKNGLNRKKTANLRRWFFLQ
jgi:hypothetical protein